VQCVERDRLFGEYNKLAMDFANAAGELAGSNDYHSLKKSQDAGALCKSARRVWARHIKKHGCGRGVS
jgi:hypothetical protein